MSETGTGTYQTGETVYQGYSTHTATSTAKVIAWSNNKLTLKNINGNFISTSVIKGLNTNANYKFTGYYPSSSLLAKIEAFGGTSADSIADRADETVTADNTDKTSTIISEYPNG